MFRTISSLVAALDEFLLLGKQGGQAALRQFLESAFPIALRVTIRHLADRAEAESLAREVVEEIWEGLSDFNDQDEAHLYVVGRNHRAHLVGLIATVARRRAIDRVRSAGARQRVLDAALREEPVHSPSPEEQLAAREIVEKRVAWLEKTSGKLGEAVRLRLCGLSNREAAERQGITEEAQARRLNCARQKFEKGGEP